jgi:hypothetical protein
LRQLSAKRWFVLVAWQLGLILPCGLNVFNALLASDNGHTLPFLQLTATCTLVLLMHVWRYPKSDISGLTNIIVSVFSDAGDGLTIYAYNTTSLSCPMLFSTNVVFWVAPLAFLVLRRAPSFAARGPFCRAHQTLCRYGRLFSRTSGLRDRDRVFNRRDIDVCTSTKI